MRSFSKGQRVTVRRTDSGIVLGEHGAGGIVARIQTGGGAWIALDKRSDVPGAHPFPVDDERRARVRAFPDDCDPGSGDPVVRARMEAPEQPIPKLEQFGKDHWSTFAYIETLCVDGRGEPDIRRMRCDADRHPHWVHVSPAFAGKKYPTRLKCGVEISDHDDWDCALDLARAGLIEVGGSGLHPAFKMTVEGTRVAAMLRAFKANGGNFATFDPGPAQGAAIQP